MKKLSYIIGGTTAFLLFACSGNNRQYDASGVFETTEVTVSANGNGEIMRFDVKEGDLLKAGQVVGYLDTVQLYLKSMELSGNLEVINSRRYDVSRQTASVKQEIATQKREKKRFENLVKDDAANRKQLDDINAQIAFLERQLAAQIETLENGNRGVDGQIRMLEAQKAQLEDQIDKCVITSPIDGTVLSKYAEQGELATQGRSLFKIGDLNNMYLRVYITAGQLSSLKLGQEVKVYADEGEKDRREYRGIISWISDKAEFTPKTIQTRDERANLVYAVKVAVKNDGFIKNGMYGDIKIN